MFDYNDPFSESYYSPYGGIESFRRDGTLQKAKDFFLKDYVHYTAIGAFLLGSTLAGGGMYAKHKASQKAAAIRRRRRQRAKRYRR